LERSIYKISKIEIIKKKLEKKTKFENKITWKWTDGKIARKFRRPEISEKFQENGKMSAKNGKIHKQFKARKIKCKENYKKIAKNGKIPTKKKKRFQEIEKMKNRK